MKVFKNKMDSIAEWYLKQKNFDFLTNEKDVSDNQLSLIQRIIDEELYLVDQEAIETKTKEHNINKNKELGLIETFTIHSFNTIENLDKIIHMV